MNRNDEYGLNSNESYIYRMTRVILELVKDVDEKEIETAMNESIELGIGRIINGEYNYNLVKSRLCNWFAVEMA